MQTLLNLFASVALLVWGTHIVRTGILRVYGANLRRVLSKSVSNRASAFVAGLGVTSLVQSSSATALITSSFVSQNLIALAPALAIMLGADVGTALMAQVFSLDLAWLSPLALFFGVVFFLSRKNTKAGQLGRVSIGLGLIILALQLIQEATKPIVSAAGTKVLFGSLSGDPMLDMLIGALFTVLLLVEPRGRAAHGDARRGARDLGAGGAVPRPGRQPRQRPHRRWWPRSARPGPGGAWRWATSSSR